VAAAVDEKQHEIARNKKERWLAHQKVKPLPRQRETYGGLAGRQPHYLIPPYSAPNQWGPPQTYGEGANPQGIE
jgi:hypothetical protein